MKTRNGIGSIRSECWITLAGLYLLSAVVANAQDAPCLSTNPVSCVLKSHTPLLYPGGLKVFNLYWADNWDQRPSHSAFQIMDIDNATTALVNSNYFDKLGQYGIKGLAWGGSTNTNRFLIPCVRNPLAEDTIFSVFAFLTCMESSGPGLGGVPFQVAAPTGTCAACATTPGACFTNETDPCVFTPNATGNTIYNIFLPQDTKLKDGGGSFVSCATGSYRSFHFQIPSLPIAFLAGTQGRPLYFTVIPTACSDSISTMMKDLSHELAEAATDPLPLFHWYDESTLVQAIAKTDFTHLALLAKDTEVGDLCESQPSALYRPPDGKTPAFQVAQYLSNSDNRCIPGGLPQPIPLPAFSNIAGVSAFYSPDDDDRHIIVGAGDGNVTEVFYNTPNASGNSLLTNLAGITGVGGFFSSDDNFRHAIIATNDGNVADVFYHPDFGSGQSVLTNLNGLVGVAGFFSSDDNFRHAITATNDGNVTEFFYNSQGQGQSVLTNLNGIVGVAAFFSSDDNTRHALIATNDGNVTEVFYNSQGQGQSVLTNLAGITAIGGFFSSDDNFRHAIIATNDGNVTEFFYNPELGSGQAVLANFDGIVAVAGFFTPNDNTRHVIVATNDGRLHEVSFNVQQGTAIR